MFLKRLYPRTLFSLTPSSLPSPYSISIAHCSSSSPSHLTYPDSRNVPVSAWWDFESCNVPSGVELSRVSHAIKAAIRSCGIKGPINNITAFGDMLRFARANEEAIINFSHVPHGGDWSADKSLFIDLMFWVSQNPPPAHLFIITDRGSSSILHRLRMNNYNILLATKKPAPPVLRSAATIMCNWDDLVRGENLTRRYFNQPPEGWYDHYEGPLEDPFAET